MDEVVIQAQGLTKAFRSRQRGQVMAVAGLDLRVTRGDIYGLIGPDGAGKSTTSRLLSGLLRPTAGCARVLDFDIADERQTRRMKAHIGYMPQRANLYGDLTVKENMRLFARLQGMERRVWAARTAELLRFVGLQDVEDRLGSQLSGGMRQKLALTCALIHSPQVLFLDEPTLGVDPVSRREFWHLLGRLRTDQGVTVFVCTPYMDEAERCQRVGLLYQGRMLAEDTPAAIRRRLDGQLLDCRPSDLRRARELASVLPGVIEVQTLGDRLRVFVDDADRRLAELMAAFTATGLLTDGIRQVQPGLEDTFISLVRRRAVAQPDTAQGSESQPC
jgi:ABC-2 type transport system ATP-binding protein